MVYLSIIIFLGITASIYSTIRLEINNLEYHKEEEKQKNQTLNKDIIMKLIILKKIPVVKIKLTKERLIRILNSSKAKKIEMKEEEKIIKNKKEFDVKILRNVKYLKDIKMEIKKFNLNMQIGVEDVMIKSMLVAISSAVIANVLATKVKKLEDIYFKIAPYTTDVNKLDVKFSGTIDIEMRSIVKVYKKMKKENKKINKSAEYKKQKIKKAKEFVKN